MPSNLGVVASGYYSRPMWIGVSGAVTDYLMAYPFDTYTGFGTKIAAPSSSPPGSMFEMSWNNDNSVVVGSENTSTDSLRLGAWAWSNGSWGTKYTSPSSVTAQNHRYPRFSPAGTDVVSGLANAAATTVDAYPWSNGWGARYTSPTFVAGQNMGEFALNGTAIIFGIVDNTTPLAAYPFTSGTGFGTKYSDPATLPTSQTTFVAWDENTQTVITSQGNSSPYINAYPFSGSGWGTRFTISNAFTTAVQDIAIDKRGQSVYFLQSATISRRAWSASGFGSNLTNVTSPLAASGTINISISPDNAVLVQTSAGASPYIKAWRITSSTTTGTAYSAPADVSLSNPRSNEFSN